MDIFSKVLSFSLVLFYFYAPEISSINADNFLRKLCVALIFFLLLARHDILHGVRSYPVPSASIGFLLLLAALYLWTNKQKRRAKRKCTKAHRARRIYRSCLVKYQKALTWLYSSSPEKYAEELEQIGYKAVNSKMRLFYLSIFLPYASFNYSSIQLFLAAAIFFGVLCIGRVMQRYFFRVLAIAVLLVCGSVWSYYDLFGYEAMVTYFLSDQPVAQSILEHSSNETQAVAFLCGYLSGIFILVAVFVGGSFASIRYTLVKVLYLVKSITVRTSLFKRQRRKALQKI